LLGHIDIDTNFECSKLIYEILFIIIGSRNDQNPEIQSEIVNILIVTIQQSFKKYDEYRDKSLHRERIQMMFVEETDQLEFVKRRDNAPARTIVESSNKDINLEALREPTGSMMVKK
jgi:hypothetical protein